MNPNPADVFFDRFLGRETTNMTLGSSSVSNQGDVPHVMSIHLWC